MVVNHGCITPFSAPELRHDIIAALNRETAQPVSGRAGMTRRPLSFGSIAALAAAVIAVILIRGMGPEPNSTFEAAATDYLQCERRFTSNSAVFCLLVTRLTLAQMAPR